MSKRKKKPLKERKANSNSTYWRDKADVVFMAKFVGQPCEICSSLGITNTYRTCGHHVVEKSISAYFRHIEQNMVVACESHHLFSNELAFHSKNLLAANAALDWLRECRPDALECLEVFKLPKYRGAKVDYEAVFYKYEKV